MFDFNQFLKDLLSEGFVWSDDYLVKKDNKGVIHTYTPNENDGSYLHQQFRCIGGVGNRLISSNRVVCTFS